VLTRPPLGSSFFFFLDTPQKWQYFEAGYPGSSPHVLSVGSTRLTSFANEACREGSVPKQLCPLAEVAATLDTGAPITSGGGFADSARHPALKAPAWQKVWTESYLDDQPSASKPPHGSYDRVGRGFPDVAAVAVNCLTVDMLGTTAAKRSAHTAAHDAGANAATLSAVDARIGQIEGNASATSGPVTAAVSSGSCATAIVAGIVAMLADVNLRKHGVGLGPVAERFYRAAAQRSGAFYDVVGGNNTCARGDCCLFGYESAPGWDALTGLGSIAYPGLRRAMFPEDYGGPGFAETPGVGGEARYASRGSLPWIILPLMIIGFLGSAALIALFGRRIKDLASRRIKL
jgi:hypothetical protein